MNKTFSIRYLTLQVISALALTACNSGTDGGSSASTNMLQKQIFISQTSQLLTPLSARTDFNSNDTATHTIKNKAAADNACIALVSGSNNKNYQTTINSSQYWSTGSVAFELKNTCNSAQAFSVNVVLNDLQVNGSPVSSSSLSTSQNSNPYMTTEVVGAAVSPIVTVSTPSCDGDYCDWAKLGAGATSTIIVQTSYSGLINSLTVSNISLGNTPAPPPTPVEPGNLSLTLNADELSSLCNTTSCNLKVNVLSPANVVVATESINPAINKSAIYTISNLAVGQYSIVVVPDSIPSVTGGTISYTYYPAASFAIDSETTSYESVNFTYSANPTANMVKVNLATIANAAMFEDSVILGRVLDSGNNVVQNIQLGLGKTSTITSNALIQGDSYTLQIQGLADPKSKTYYSPIIQKFTIDSSETDLNESYSVLPQKSLFPVQFNIVNPESGQMVSFASDYNYFAYHTEALESGIYYFPESDIINANISSVTGYSTSTSPSPLIIGRSSGSSANVINTPIAATGMMTGYLSNSYGIGRSVYTTISEAAQAGYNTQVIAFAELNNEKPLQFYGDQFLAYTSWQTFSACPSAAATLKNDIANAKKNYGLKYVLVSVGGANSTLDLSGNPNPKIVAQNVINFLDQYDLDGIDFDVEQKLDPVLLQSILQNIKTLRPNVIITAAPQANMSGNAVQFVTTSTYTDYNQSIAAGLFDFIWLQAYNTGGNDLPYMGNLYQQYDPQYVPASYYYFTNPTTPGYVPAGTMLAIGEPATEAAAGDATVWHNPLYTTPQQVYQALAQNYSLLNGEKQYGGAMTWSINQDIDGGCGFANNIAPVVGGISSSQIVCPTNGNTYHGELNPNNC